MFQIKMIKERIAYTNINNKGTPAARKSKDVLGPAKGSTVLNMANEPIIKTIKPIIPSATGIRCEIMERFA